MEQNTLTINIRLEETGWKQCVKKNDRTLYNLLKQLYDHSTTDMEHVCLSNRCIELNEKKFNLSNKTKQS